MVEYNYPSSSRRRTNTATAAARVVVVDGKQVGGAALAGAAVGLTVFGPMVALLTGGIAAGLAGVDKGVVGDAARKSGDVVVVVHGQVRKVEEEYCVVDGTKRIARRVVDRVREIGTIPLQRYRDRLAERERPPPYNPGYDWDVLVY